MATTSTRKPVAKTKPLMKAVYSDLVAVNFQIDAKILRPLVPPGLELDFYHGETFISLIAMMIKNVKIWGLPFSLVPSCPELSLRFYVQRKDGDQVEKGACLIKDYISGSTAAWFLESQFKSEFAKMKIKSVSSGFGENIIPEVEYQWKVDDHWNKLRVRARSKIKRGPNPLDTKVGFILDHNNYFSTFEGKTVAYRVERPKWEIWDAAQANFTCDVSQLFGKEFVKPLAKRPASVFVAGGSAVTIYKPVVVH